MNVRDEVVVWLRDAYSMERGLEAILKKQSEHDGCDQEVKRAVARHLEEARLHAQTVESLLSALGSRTPLIETTFGIMAEAMSNIGASLSYEEPIKDLLTSYAMEHFEIACYKTLISAAEAANLPHVAEACRKIISDEERMAEIIDRALPRVVEQHLATAS